MRHTTEPNRQKKAGGILYHEGNATPMCRLPTQMMAGGGGPVRVCLSVQFRQTMNKQTSLC